MSKTILITGATDGIGLEAAKRLAREGHRVLVHGRSKDKLDAACSAIGGTSQGYLADLSLSQDVSGLTRAIRRDHARIDVLINNAGVLKAPETITPGGLELRFMVNTIAPYMLTQGLLDLIPTEGRIINLSSAAQAPVDVAGNHDVVTRPCRAASGRAERAGREPRIAAGQQDGQGRLWRRGQ